MLALNPDGTGYEWSPDHSKMSYDPLQGPAYHLSKTKDFVSGQVRKRLSNPLCEPFYQDRLGTNTAGNSEKTRFSQRIKRLEKIFDTVPVNSSLHCDAWRDINLSYEQYMLI